MMTAGANVLFIDAYDSFSENIIALLRQLLLAKVSVIRIDSNIPDLSIPPCPSFRDRLSYFLCQFDAIVIGPGPGDPNNHDDIGIISQVWEVAEQHNIPVLGICLGFQSLCLAYGASVQRLSEPCHGHATEIFHSNKDIFENVGQVIATNYHSLHVHLDFDEEDDVPSRPASTGSLDTQYSSTSHSSRNSAFFAQEVSAQPQNLNLNIKPLAWTMKGDARHVLMAARHVSLPFWGLQFHPESCKSNLACHVVIQNWWRYVEEAQKGKMTVSMPLNSPEFDAFSSGISKKPSLLPDTHVGPDGSLQKYLREISVSSQSIVQCTALQTSIDVQRVAELCSRSSPTNSTMMLESTKKGRFSVYAMPSTNSFRLEYFIGTRLCLVYTKPKGGECRKFTTPDIFEDIYQLVSSKAAKYGDSESPFWGGFLGYFSYETGLETLNLPPDPANENRKIPDISLLWVERSIVIDHLHNTVYIQSIRNNDSAWISDTRNKLLNLPPGPTIRKRQLNGLNALLESAQITIPEENAYKANIARCQSFLRAGSSYELCLTSQAKIVVPKVPNSAWLLYQNLQYHNPAPFSAFALLGNMQILSSSPEQFLTWDRCDRIDMMPMKGTVAKSSEMTFAIASEVLSSPKESAENLMIADLIRHDLYSAVGTENGASVEVVRLCEVIEHETVYQLVSHIRATAPVSQKATSEANAAGIMYYGHKALQHCIPPGSMTGAPKKRSCEILKELEKSPRGIYSGVLGYLDVGGGGSFNVCIRTAFCDTTEDTNKGTQTWRIGAGGAVTVLSDIDGEWEEMKTKLNSVLRAFRTGH